MNKKGFTLIELLIVVSIIGLLSTLAVVALGSARVKARDSKRLADLKQMQTALELYYTDQNAYPAGAGTGVATAIGTTPYACLNNIAAGFGPTGCTSPYMAAIPTDPKSGNYTYTYNAASSTYTLNATLEGAINGFTAGSITLRPSGMSQP